MYVIKNEIINVSKKFRGIKSGFFGNTSVVTVRTNMCTKYAPKDNLDKLIIKRLGFSLLRQMFLTNKNTDTEYKKTRAEELE